MKITVIGCSGSYPGPDSPASCYLVEAQDGPEGEGRTWRILVELGNGALGALHNYVDPLSIDAVLLSHLHPDHCLDLCGYYVMRKYHPTGRQQPIPVYGPAGTEERMARAYDLPDGPGMGEEFDFRTYDGAVEIGPFSIEAVPVDHPVDAFGMRITAHGRTLGYSGDTGPCPGFDHVAEDVDLLLAEASFREIDENPPNLHLTGAECGTAATRGRAKRLVLTHIPPWFDKETALSEARGTFTGPTELARPGATYDLG